MALRPAASARKHAASASASASDAPAASASMAASPTGAPHTASTAARPRRAPPGRANAARRTSRRRTLHDRYLSEPPPASGTNAASGAAPPPSAFLTRFSAIQLLARVDDSHGALTGSTGENSPPLKSVGRLGGDSRLPLSRRWMNDHGILRQVGPAISRPSGSLANGGCAPPYAVGGSLGVMIRFQHMYHPKGHTIGIRR